RLASTYIARATSVPLGHDDRAASRICRFIDRVGGAAADRALRGVAAGACALLVRARVHRVRRGKFHLPSATGAIVPLVVGTVAGVRAVHGHLFWRGGDGDYRIGP